MKSVMIEIADGIATISLNRPAALNSMNQDLVAELYQLLLAAQEDSNIRVVIITGVGKAFCAGGDLFYIEGVVNQGIVAARKFVVDVEQLTATIMKMGKPVIAAVNGAAAGAGFNLALACDVVFCAKSAKFGQSFVKLGLVPDCGGMFLLPRVVGIHKAKEIMFTGDLLDADTAFSLGIVNHVVDDRELLATAKKFAVRMAEAAPLSIGLMKKIINRSIELDLDAILEYETNMQTICFQTEDYIEGLSAFKEKRAPKFSGI